MRLSHVVRRAAIALVVLLVVLGACGGTDQVSDSPGAGTQVTMARATWSTGWFQAEVYADLLRRLGYEVSDPAERTLAQAEFYDAAARGEVDLWANGWFPGNERELERSLDDVGRIGDLVEPIGLQVEQGAREGILIDTETVSDAGIRTLGDIVGDVDLVELFDADGNGRAEILGCPEDWDCARKVDELIAGAGAEVLEQLDGDYDEFVQLAQRRIQAGEPLLIFAWTPTATVEILALGEAVAWLDTSPAGPPDSVVVMERGECTMVQCRMGFPVQDIRVAANSRFLAENPAAAALFEVVEIPVEDIQAQNLAALRGADTPNDLADQVEAWLGARRGQVLDWLRAARRAADDS